MLTPAQTLKIELNSCDIRTMNTVPAPYRVTMMQNTETYLFNEGNFDRTCVFLYGTLTVPTFRLSFLRSLDRDLV